MRAHFGRGRAAKIAARTTAIRTIATRTMPFATLPVVGMLLGVASPTFAQTPRNPAGPSAQSCAGDNGGITLPSGFCATVFADNVGHARHMVVAPNGVLYVNTWSGRYYGNDMPPDGGFLIALQDTKGDGRANVVRRFGDTFAEGNHGGTGIALYNGALYAETNDRIVRYALPSGTIAPTAKPETIVSGLPLTGDHPMHPFIIDRDGNLFVDLGSATNSCQVKNRTLKSPGINPCTELETRAGTWRYDAKRTGQHFSPAERYVPDCAMAKVSPSTPAAPFTPPSTAGITFGELAEALQARARSAEPAEELVRLEHGADYGWPECYFDGQQQKLVLAPEYGGDGGKAVGVCAQKRAPIAWFPAHWAPNDLAII